MGRPTLGAILITYDADRLLERALDSVRWMDEIVVVDRGSTDRTEEIARRYTERFFVREWAGFGIQKQRALELATTDWVLVLDADEVVTPELQRAITEAVADPGGRAGFFVRLHTCMGGQWFGSRGWRHDLKLRLLRRDRARFSLHEVHEGAHVDGPVGRLAGVLLHYPYRDIEHQAEKLNLYSTGIARRKHAAGKRGGALGAVLRGVARFLRDYVAGGEFLYGGAGLLRASLAGYYAFLTHAKLWELGLPSADCPADGGPRGQERPSPGAAEDLADADRLLRAE